jgi:hypothetical protein
VASNSNALTRGTKETRTMTTSSHRGSATIHQFPARVRPALGGQRETARENPTAPNLASLRVTNAACGSAWYHEAAVEAERAGNN